VTDFDRLPIPFRAAATDLETGQLYVFDRGDLAVAMRASMAVPGAFAPVEHDGKVLVDGMLVRNLPVDVARQTCADVVIAVPVGNPAISRDKLGRLTSVAGQAMNIAVEANEKAQLATLGERDVAVPVTLKDIGSSDFAQVPEAIPLGEAAARAVAASLARYSLSPEAYAHWRAGRRQIAERPKVTVDEVRMAGFRVTNPEVMRSFVQTRPGDAYDPERADADTTRIAARGDFTAVAPQLAEEPDGRHVLTYRATEKPWGPDYVMFDLNLGTDLQGKTEWGIRVDLEKRWLNALGGEMRAIFQVGSPNLLGLEFYQPLDLGQRFFVAPSLSARQKLYTAYGGDQAVATIDETRYGGALEVGATLGTSSDVRLGLAAGRIRNDASVGVPWITDTAEADLGAVTLSLRHDSLDRRIFPSEGTLATLTAGWSEPDLGADQRYRLASFRASQVLTWGSNVWSLALRGGSSFDTDVPYYDQFKAGGLFNFSGYRHNELVGRRYAFAGVQWRHRLGYLMQTLGSDTWGGLSLESGNVYDRADGTPASGALTGGSIFLGINSRLGPVYLGYGRSQGGHRALYLYLGSSLDTF
jgi:NTE family protein